MSENTNAKNSQAPEAPLQGPPKVVSWVAQILAAVIMGQTLFFKFTAAPESVAIFEQLGAEPWGRIATGILEAVAILLLLVPGMAFLGGGSRWGSWEAPWGPTSSLWVSRCRVMVAPSSDWLPSPSWPRPWLQR